MHHFICFDMGRYKIYIEGRSWSVSEKYILACDAMTLYINSKYHDFFSRGLIPLQHYWPISDTAECKSLKFAVEWGNNHTHQVIYFCFYQFISHHIHRTFLNIS